MTRWLLAGASGFLGTALRVRLAEEGHDVVRLVRRKPATGAEFGWDPDAGQLDRAALDGVDVVVNLSGVGIANGRWTPKRRELLLTSRTHSTRTLAGALADQAGLAPTPVLLQGSAIAWYGTQSTDTGRPLRAHPHTEDDAPAGDFLAQLVKQWEQAAEPAVRAGVRVVKLRTTPVLDRSGGAFKLMKLAWSFGGGAVLGTGTQRMPMISLEDWLRFALWAADHPEAAGPYNLTIPTPGTNQEFSDELAHQLHRPRLLTAPGRLVRAPLGEMADQLLNDCYVIPRSALEQGFAFTAPDVSATVRAALAGVS